MCLYFKCCILGPPRKTRERRKGWSQRSKGEKKKSSLVFIILTFTLSKGPPVSVYSGCSWFGGTHWEDRACRRTRTPRKARASRFKRNPRSSSMLKSYTKFQDEPKHVCKISFKNIFLYVCFAGRTGFEWTTRPDRTPRSHGMMTHYMKNITDKKSIFMVHFKREEKDFHNCKLKKNSVCF